MNSTATVIVAIVVAAISFVTAIVAAFISRKTTLDVSKNNSDLEKVKLDRQADLTRYQSDRQEDLAKVQADRQAALAKVEEERKKEAASLDADRKNGLARLQNEFEVKHEVLKRQFEVERAQRLASNNAEGPLGYAASQLRSLLRNITEQYFAATYLHHPARKRQVEVSTCYNLANFWAACIRYHSSAFPSDQYGDRDKVVAVRTGIHKIQKLFSTDDIRDGIEFWTDTQVKIAAKMTKIEGDVWIISSRDKFEEEYDERFSEHFQLLIRALKAVDRTRPSGDVALYNRLRMLQDALEELLFRLDFRSLS